MIKSLIVAGLVLLFTSPWWITILSQHSLAPILAAGGTGFYDYKEVIKFLQFDLTNEYRLKTIGTLGLIGLFWLVAKRKYLVPAWVMVTFLAEPRSAPLYLTPCIAILASYALYKVLLFIDKKGTSSEKENIEPQPLSSRLSKGLFILLFGQWVFSAMAVATLVTLNVSMTTQDKDAFDWIKKHTPANSQFLVLTGDLPLTDPVSEWFPALTERISVATAQGHEWDTSGSFEEKLTESLNVQACNSLAYACIEDWATKNGRQLDYIYIHMPVQQGGAELEQAYTSALGDLSVSQGKTELVYENDAVAVYKVK